jgi:hypothetical protein
LGEYPLFSSHLLGPDSPWHFLLGISLSRFYLFPIPRAKVSYTILTTTMIVSLLFLLALVAGGDAYVLARRVEQSIENRQAYHGGYGLVNPASCPANYSMSCTSKSDLNQLCCPQGNTCFGSYIGYCCPTCKSLLRLYGSAHQCQFEMLMKWYSSGLWPLRYHFPLLCRSNVEHV